MKTSNTDKLDHLYNTMTMAVASGELTSKAVVVFEEELIAIMEKLLDVHFDIVVEHKF